MGAQIRWKPRRGVVFSVVALVTIVALSSLAVSGKAHAATDPFSGTGAAGELLGIPTDTSIVINVVPAASVRYYYQYGTSPGTYTQQTSTFSVTGGHPSEETIAGLIPDTKYYYRMQYSTDGASTWTARTAQTFHTARVAGDSFIVTVTSDGHGGSANTPWANILSELPDFNIDLGDTFTTDGATSQSQINGTYLAQRGTAYIGKIGASVPIFLSSGNHENEEGWNLDDTPFSQAVGSMQARKAFFPTPEPGGGFYSANADPSAYIDALTYGDQYREDYYAWTWGDALFVVIDPFQYTMNLPYAPVAGEGTNDQKTGDQWSWTLGKQQYDWLKQTLESSHAKYKFVFSHNMLGGINRPIAGADAGYVRGGAEAAAFYEWGGRDASGNYVFDTKRPGWGEPIEQLFTDNGVSAYFHGHDHQYVYETRDGIVYQCMPPASSAASSFSGAYSVGNYSGGAAGAYSTNKIITNVPGHLRISVTPSKATVDFVSSANAVQYSYDIQPNSSTVPIITGVSPNSGPTTGGTSVIITGANLTGATAVTFGGAPASSFAVNSASRITATSPAHAAGAVTLQVTTPSGSVTWSYTYAAPPPSTRYDQTNANIKKTGFWANYAAGKAWGGSYGRSSSSGASATIYFTGTRLDWIAMKGVTAGIADVYLDGTKVATINLYSATPTYNVMVWSTGTLASGGHSVKIVRSTANGTGKFVTLDAVDIWGTIKTGP